MNYTRVRARNLEARLIRAGFYCASDDRSTWISMGWDGFLAAEYGSIEEAIMRLGGESLVKVQTSQRSAGPVMVMNDRVNLPSSMPVTMMSGVFKLAVELVEDDYYVYSNLYTRLGVIGNERQRALKGELPPVSLHRPDKVLKS